MIHQDYLCDLAPPHVPKLVGISMVDMLNLSLMHRNKRLFRNMLGQLRTNTKRNLKAMSHRRCLHMLTV
jgi:hypothetical protein